MSPDPYRLPRQTRPERYDIRLEPDLEAASFAGTVTIAVTTDEAADVFVLNAAELEIASCRVDGQDADFVLDEALERLTIARAAAVGEHAIEIAFTGVLNDQLRGWYRSTYTDDDGTERVIATSQMQSTDCRRAFPCWDEPDFKAVFGVTLVVDADLTAVSNGREIERSVVPGSGGATHQVRFADTMIMSSYLVAFVVGPLEATDWVDVDGVPIRIVHVPGKGHLTEFGLDVAAFALRWFQEYYDIDYPSDKCDLLALPDFAAGAMENLGCITFRENLLLVDPATATQNERQAVADVVAHELAHMWFGDLVTMDWWNGIWLNEAFATFMEIAACDAYRPEWRRWDSFGWERSFAFETDALSATRPVEFEVRSPADAEGMFDVLTYQKGGALLRMLEQYLGEHRFRDGVRHYLTTHAYGNTDTGDLWDAIEHTTGEPVRRIMDSWIWQPGFPLVEAGVEGGEIVLRQERFRFGPEATDPTIWAIPVKLRLGDTTSTVLLDGDEVRLPDTGEPLVVNAGGHGFYRIAYRPELRARLDAAVVTRMAALERYHLVDDAWNAVVAQRLSPIALLELIERYDAEREYGVWQGIATAIRGLGRLIGDAPERAEFQLRIGALLRSARADLGEPSDADDDLRAKLRGLLLSLAAIVAEDARAIATARETYAAWSADRSSVDPELAAAATAAVATHGDAGMYARMRAIARDDDNPQVALRHLFSLAEFDDAELVAQTCELAMTSEVKTQNAPFLLRSCIASRRHGPTSWQFVRERWSEVNERFPRNTIVRLVDAVKLLDEAAIAADVHAFFSEHPIEQASKTLEQILERLDVNTSLRANAASGFAAALRG